MEGRGQFGLVSQREPRPPVSVKVARKPQVSWGNTRGSRGLSGRKQGAWREEAGGLIGASSSVWGFSKKEHRLPYRVTGSWPKIQAPWQQL